MAEPVLEGLTSWSSSVEGVVERTGLNLDPEPEKKEPAPSLTS